MKTGLKEKQRPAMLAVAAVIVFVLCCWALCRIAVAAAQAQQATQQAGKPRVIVARVNGQPLYEDRLAADVKKDLKKFRKYGMQQGSPELVKRVQKKALEKVIGQELILQESRKLTIDNVDAKVEEKFLNLKRKYAPKERFDNFLKTKDMTEQALRETLKENLYVDTYLKQQGVVDPDISERQIRDFYDGNPNDYARDESLKVSHILVAVKKDDPKEKEQALEKARKIRKEIATGHDFAELAKQYSDCNSAAGGGKLGTIRRGYMPEEFDRVAFALDEGAVSQPVLTKFGYHIIKAGKKTPAGITPYEDVKDFIRKFLQMEASQKRLDALIARLRKQATIEIFLDRAESAPQTKNSP